MSLYYMVIAIFMCYLSASTSLRIIIDCRSEGNAESRIKDKNGDLQSSITEFCRVIHKTMLQPESEGKLAHVKAVHDQEDASNDKILISTLPPKSLLIKKLQVDNHGLPKLRIPRVKIPRIKVPKLEQSLRSPEFRLPIVVDSRPYSKINNVKLEYANSSAERLESFKKGVQEMLNIVKVLGKIDQYLSDRIRIIVDKISKVISE